MAFTRTSPVSARVSHITLTSINLPWGHFKSSDYYESTQWLAAWVWAALHCLRSTAAGLRHWQLAIFVTQLARAILTTRYWQSEQRHRCRRAAAAVEPANLKQVHLNLLQNFKFKFKLTCKLIPIISSFNVLPHISKLKFKNSQGFKFKTLPLHKCTGSRSSVGRRSMCQSYDCIMTGCQPDLELSSRRYCILSRGNKFKTLLRHGPGARSQRRRPPLAHACHMILDWQSLAASLTWSCRPGVTVLAL